MPPNSCPCIWTHLTFSSRPPLVADVQRRRVGARQGPHIAYGDSPSIVPSTPVLTGFVVANPSRKEWGMGLIFRQCPTFRSLLEDICAFAVLMAGKWTIRDVVPFVRMRHGSHIVNTATTISWRVNPYSFHFIRFELVVTVPHCKTVRARHGSSVFGVRTAPHSRSASPHPLLRLFAT